MRSSWLWSVAFVACVSFVSQVGHAETHVVVHAGAWDAFEGTTGKGTAVCGVSAKEENIYFGLKYFEAQPTFTIQVGGKNFKSEDDVKQPVLLQFDRRSPWHAKGTGMRFGDGDPGLEFDVSQKQLHQFMREFRHGRILRLRFPDSGNPDWTLSLAGTSKVSEAFLSCVDKLRGPAPQS